MFDWKTKQVRRLLILLDALLSIWVFLLSFWVGVFFFSAQEEDIFTYLAISPIFALPFVFFMLRFGGYYTLRVSSPISFSVTVLKAMAIAMAILFAFLYATQLDYVSRGVLMVFFLAEFVAIVGMRSLLVWWYFRRAVEKGENYHKVLVIGTGSRARKVTELLKSHSEWGVDIIGYLDPQPDQVEPEGLPAPVLGSVDDVGDVLSRHVVDEVIMAVPRGMISDIQAIVDACEEQGVRFSLMADMFDLKVARQTLRNIEGVPLLTFEPVSQPETDLLIKRMFDLVVTLASMPFVLPIMAVVAIAIKLDSPGPVFFVQQRVGYRKRIFPMYKFRSMHVDAEERLKEIEHLNEADGPIFKITDDPRVTRVGKFIRRTSLDELPQLFNVIRGHMSLVGPRPMSIRDVDLFDRGIQRKRFSVKPGLTCLWQISGRSNLPFEKWLELDLEYIDNWSLELDLKILVKTIPAVLLSKGAV